MSGNRLKNFIPILALLGFGVILIWWTGQRLQIFRSNAASSPIETENSVLNGNVSKGTDSSASNNEYIQFATTTGIPLTPVPTTSPTTSFSFGAVGDLGASSNTTGVLDALKDQNLAFMLADGDLSYSTITPETAWCDYVKSHVGTTFPFLIGAGNHEDDGPDGVVSNFTTCLPNRMANSTGVYGKEYYFDYPTTSPLARIIYISPNLTFPNEGTYSYALNTTRYNWTKSVIDDARARGIKWVIVAMHKYCISMVNGNCEVGKDIMNLLISKKVDLYLQAHDHAYARSKQLSFNTSCSAITPGTYNASCVSDTGADNLYQKNNGPVLMTVGSGGESINQEDPSDPEAPFFANWMGSNVNPTYGFMKFTVSSSQLTAQFIKGKNLAGTFTDTFTVRE